MITLNHHIDFSQYDRVLCLDPSFNYFGALILDLKTEEVIHSKVIKTKKTIKSSPEDTVLRTKIILSELIQLIQDYKPGLILFENPVGTQSSVAGNVLSTVRCICVSLEFITGLKTEYISANSLKKILGVNQAKKNGLDAKEEILKIITENYPQFNTKMDELKVKSKVERYTHSDCLAVYHAIKTQ